MTRPLSWSERKVWGICPVCGAPPGERCRVVGGPEEAPAAEITHVARIQRAPVTVADGGAP